MSNKKFILVIKSTALIAKQFHKNFPIFTSFDKKSCLNEEYNQ